MEKKNKIAAIQQGDVYGPMALAFARTEHYFSNNSTQEDAGNHQRAMKKISQVTQDSYPTPINFYTFDTRAKSIASGMIYCVYKVLKITELDNCL